jgi:hypothetical protein
MNMLIQPRHAKLGLAGKAENWPRRLRIQGAPGGFHHHRKRGAALQGLPVADLFDAAMKQIFPIMDFAIKAGDPASSASPTQR